MASNSMTLALPNITKHVTQLVKTLRIGTYLYKHDSNINTQTVYTATTQTDFVRIVTIMILLHFISNWTILMF